MTVLLNNFNHRLELAEMVGNPAWLLYLELDWEKGTAEFVTGHESARNTTSFRDWHGHSHTLLVPSIPDALQAAAFFSDDNKAAELLREVAAGYSSRWNGSNHVAEFTDEAQMAMEALLLLLEQEMSYRGALYSDGVDLWDAAAWFEADPPQVLSYHTDETLERIAASLQEVARSEGVVVYGVEEYLADLREEARGVDEARHRDRETIAQIFVGGSSFDPSR